MNIGGRICVRNVQRHPSAQHVVPYTSKHKGHLRLHHALMQSLSEMGYLVLVLVLGCDVLVPIKKFLNFLTAKVLASSSPVEHMFSHGGIIRPHRARMSDKLFSHLILLKYNSRKPTWCIVTNDWLNIKIQCARVTSLNKLVCFHALNYWSE